MLSVILAILTVILVFVSLFLVLVVLAQKSKDGGMGAAFGGGAAEAAFGAETNNVLSKSTIYSSVLFFVLAFIVYLGRIYERNHAHSAGEALPSITAPATAPAATSSTATPAPAVNVPMSKAPATSTPAAAAPAATHPNPAPAAPATPAPDSAKK